MNDILTIILANSGWIIAAMGFLFPPVRDFVIKTFQASLDKARDNNTAINERKNYVSKVRFDKEFEIYQELAEKNNTMVYVMGDAVHFVLGWYDNDPDIAKKEQIHAQKMCEAYNDADEATKKYGSFINKELFCKYKKLHVLADDLFEIYKFWYTSPVHQYKYKERTFTKETAGEEIIKLQKELSQTYDAIIDDVRKYLNSLDVIN